MSKNLSPAILMLCSGAASLNLLLATNPAFAKSNNGNSAAAQSQNKNQTQTQPVVAPSQATSSFAVGLEDLGKIFRVNFDGNVATNTVSGLSSFADFTFKGFTTQSGNTIATFDVLLDNTSSGDILSRVSGLGFNADRTVLSSSASGLFGNSHLGGSFPNQFGAIDVCFNTGNTCQGGTSRGVNNSASLPGTFDVGNFSFSLALSGSVNSLSLSNFGVRYQSISSSSLGLSGASGTGRGTSITTVTNPPVETKPPVATNPPVETKPPLFDKPIDGTPPNEPTPPAQPSNPTPPPHVSTPKPKKVPEPSTIAALTLVGAIALRSRKKQEAESEV